MIVRIVLLGIILPEIQLAMIPLPMPIISVLDKTSENKGITREGLIYQSNINKRAKKIPTPKPASNVMKIKSIDCNSPIDFAKCEQPTGNKVIRWGWSTIKQVCVSFWRGTCGGNDNHYESQADCDLYCNPNQIATDLATTTAAPEKETTECHTPAGPSDDYFMIPRKRALSIPPNKNNHRDAQAAAPDPDYFVIPGRRSSDYDLLMMPKRRFEAYQSQAVDNNIILNRQGQAISQDSDYRFSSQKRSQQIPLEPDNFNMIHRRKLLDPYYPERKFQSYSTDLENSNTPQILSQLNNLGFNTPQRRTLELYSDSQSQFGDLQSFRGLTEAHIGPVEEFRKFADETKEPLSELQESDNLFVSPKNTIDTKIQTQNVEPVLNKNISHQTQVGNKITSRYIEGSFTEIVDKKKLDGEIKTVLDILGINNLIKNPQITTAIIRKVMEAQPNLFALVFRRLGSALAKPNVTCENSSTPSSNTNDSDDYVSMETFERNLTKKAEESKVKWDEITLKVQEVLKQNPSSKLIFAPTNVSDVFTRRLKPNVLKAILYNYLVTRSKKTSKFLELKRPRSNEVSYIKVNLPLTQYEQHVHQRLSKTQLKQIKSRIDQLYSQIVQEVPENQFFSPMPLFFQSEQSNKLNVQNRNSLENLQQLLNSFSKPTTLKNYISSKETEKPDPTDINSRLNNVNQQLLHVQQMLLFLKQELTSLIGYQHGKKHKPQALRSKIPTPPPPKRPLNDLIVKYAGLGLKEVMKYPILQLYPGFRPLFYGIETTTAAPTTVAPAVEPPIDFETPEEEYPPEALYWVLRSQNNVVPGNQSVFYPRKNNILRTLPVPKPPTTLEMHMNSMNEHLIRINKMLAPLKKEVVAFVHDMSLPLPMNESVQSTVSKPGGPFQSKQSFSDPAQSFSDPVKSFSDEAQSFSDPAQSFTDPAQSFSDPAQSFTDPAQSFSDPAQSFSDPVPLRMDTQTTPKPVTIKMEPDETVTTTSRTTRWTKHKRYDHRNSHFNSYVKKGAIKKKSKTKYYD